MFLPICAQAFLTFVVWFFMYYERIGTMLKKRIKTQDLADGDYGAKVLKDVVNSSDNLENLFEVPMLFFAVCLTIQVAGITDLIYVKMGCTYVALRALHSFIHCTYNRVMHRFLAYATSTLVLLAMWIRVCAKVMELG